MSARVWLIAPLLAGCSDALSLGSDVVWNADHESGDLTQWLADGRGSEQVSGTGSAVVSKNRARGVHALELSIEAAGDDAAARLWRDAEFPEAYYDFWFLVPQQHWTASSWSIVRFASVASDGALSGGTELQLRSLPGGGYVLVVFDHHRRYLQAPLPDPPARVEPGRWFHLSVFLRQANDESGQLDVWLDGELAYAFGHRQTRSGESMRFAVMSAASALDPPAAALYVDDVAVSLAPFAR